MRDGWIETTFGDVFKIVAGKYVAKEDYVEGGKFWIYGSNSIMGKLDRYLVQQSHVVMAAIGAYAGAVRYSKEPSWINNNAMALVPSEKVMAKYLHLWLESKFDLKRVVVGTGQPYVQRPLLLEEIIELPPLPEQKRIVDLISSVDSYMEALQEQLESAKRSRNAVLHELLTAGGDDWVDTKLGLIAEFVMGQAPLGERCNKEGIGTPFVKAGEFGENRPEIIEWTTDPLKMAKHSDVLVCVVGATAGKINLGADCAIGRSVAAVRPSTKLNQLYLYYLLSLELSNLRSGSRGSAQGVITKDDLYRIPVRLPSIEEQNTTVSTVSSIDNFRDHITSTLKHVKNLRSALLSDLLSGAHEIPASYDKAMSAT